MEKNNTFTQGKILMTLTNLVSSFAMGTTVLLGQQIGCGERKQGGRTVRNGYCDVYGDRTGHDCGACDFCTTGKQHYECAGGSF